VLLIGVIDTSIYELCSVVATKQKTERGHLPHDHAAEGWTINTFQLHRYFLFVHVRLLE
jgi:hypothetical protein